MVQFVPAFSGFEELVCYLGNEDKFTVERSPIVAWLIDSIPYAIAVASPREDGLIATAVKCPDNTIVGGRCFIKGYTKRERLKGKLKAVILPENDQEKGRRWPIAEVWLADLRKRLQEERKQTAKGLADR
jgi:hypothetical protein